MIDQTLRSLLRSGVLRSEGRHEVGGMWCPIPSTDWKMTTVYGIPHGWIEVRVPTFTILLSTDPLVQLANQYSGDAETVCHRNIAA